MMDKYDIFISYSRKDTPVADRICAALDQQGITYFIDRKGIGGGMEFPAVLADAIINSKIMLFLGSANSYKSKFTNSEVTFAFNKKPMGSIIPYIIDGSELPPALEFTFSSINIRTIEEHPIETTLMKDFCQILGKTFVDKEEERRQEELKRQEELRRKEEEERRKREEELRKEEEARRAEEERLRKVEEERLKEEQRVRDEEARKAAEEKKKKRMKDLDDYSGCLMILLPLIFLGLGIWLGIRYNSFWLGAEIFLAFGWFGIGAGVSLSDWAQGKKEDVHSTIAMALLGIIIAIGIHSGIYLSSWWKGAGIGFVLLIADIIYFANYSDSKKDDKKEHTN